MTLTLDIESPITEKIREITGETSDSAAVRVALERFVRDYEVKRESDSSSEGESHDLPDEYWEDLFSEPPIPASVIDRALREERS